MALGDLEFDENGPEADKEEPQQKQTLEFVFAQNTSCHGLKNAATSRRREVKIFWVVVVLIGFGFLLSQIILLLLQYLEFSAVTEFTISNDKKIDFPSVTVCNYNKFKKSVLQQQASRYGIKYEDWRFYLTTIFGLSTWFYIYDRNGTQVSEVRKELQKTETDLRQALASQGETLNITRLVEEAAYQLEDMISLHEPGFCFWSGQEYRFCSLGDFKPVITSYGQCFTFHYVTTGAKLFQTEAGSTNGWNVLVNVNQDEYSESILNGSPEKGIKLLVHSPHVYPQMDSQGKAVGTGVHALAGISGTVHQNVKPPYGKCVERKLKYFVNYTVDGCATECLSDFIIAQCKCRAIYLPGPPSDQVPVCTPVEMTGCVVEKLGLRLQGTGSDTSSEEYYNSPSSTAKDDCDCKPACWYRNYDVSVSSAGIPNNNIADEFMKYYNVTMEEIKDNYIFLDVYFEAIGYENIIQKEGMTFIKLLSSVGGQMGLFIGASLITVFEFVEYLMMKIYLYWKERKRKKGVEEKQEEKDEKREEQNNGSAASNHSNGKKERVAYV